MKQRYGKDSNPLIMILKGKKGCLTFQKEQKQKNI